MPTYGELLAQANDEVNWHGPFGHGYTLVTLTKDKVEKAMMLKNNEEVEKMFKGVTLPVK